LERSDSEESKRFDLGAFLADSVTRPREFQALSAEFFGDLKRIERIRKELVRTGSDKAYFASSQLEEWPPAWLGAGLPRSERGALIKARLSGRLSEVQILNNLGTFLLSHVAVGAITLPAAMQHLLLVGRMLEERGRDFALRYLALFQIEMLSRLRVGQLSPNLLAGELAKVNEPIARRVELEHIRPARQQPQPQAARPAPPPRPAADGGRPPPRQTTRVTTAKGTAAASRPEPRTPPARKPVCFSHDPAGGKSCSAPDCGKEHLDTREAEGKTRFDAAKAAFDRRTARTGKSRGTRPAPAGR
jgi:hypothetical protein